MMLISAVDHYIYEDARLKRKLNLGHVGLIRRSKVQFFFNLL